MTVNQRVVGSSPTGGALKIKGLQQCSPFFIFLFAYDLHTIFADIGNKLKMFPIYPAHTITLIITVFGFYCIQEYEVV